MVLMVVLLCFLIIPLLRNHFTAPSAFVYSSLHLRRLLSEEEVMAEFLRSEFHHPEFDEYRHEFDSVVRHPDLNNSRENAVRQALLFLRRGAMWRELPADTQWFEVELTLEDLARIRFPANLGVTVAQRAKEELVFSGRAHRFFQFWDSAFRGSFCHFG